MKNKLAAKHTIWFAVLYFTFAGSCQGAEAQSEVKFRLVHETVIVVSLIANDQGPFDFVLDTGTNSTIVDPLVASRLSLTALGQVTLISVSRQTAVDRCAFQTLSLGSASARGVEVLVQDLSEMRKLDSHIVGIVGQNFLGQWNYLIDYKRRSIRIEQADEIRVGVTGDRTPFEMVEGKMIVPSSVQTSNRTSLRLLLDSGANFVTLFHAASLDLVKNLLPNQWSTNTVSEVRGEAVSRVKSLTVGAQEFHNMIVALPSSVVASQERVEDGSLPVSLFHTIYVNNREHFVVLNAALKTN